MISLDLGTRKLAYALWDEDEVYRTGIYGVPTTMGRAVQLAELAGYVYTLTDDGQHDLVWVEKPIVGNNHKYSMDISAVCGAIMSDLAHIAEVEMVDNKIWKKAIVGNGNASKEHVAAWLEATFPRYSALCGADQDQRDAVCVGLYGIYFRDLRNDIMGSLR